MLHWPERTLSAVETLGALVQDVIIARTDLLKSLASLDEDSTALQRIASSCADEAFPAGARVVAPCPTCTNMQ